MSIDWGTYSEKECLNPTADDPLDCPDTVGPTVEEPPPTPEFYLAIKPGYALREIGDPVQFATYLVNAATGEEQLLEQGLVYRSANPGQVVIGPSSGRAFGVASGIASVSVTWQDLIAHAQMEVINSCAGQSVGMLLLVDNSLSMAEDFTEPPVVAGQATYSTRFSYAKAQARKFASELNASKDAIGVIQFNAAATLVSNLSQDLAALDTAITLIPQSNGSTNIQNALTLAIATLNNAFTSGAIDRKVIVILSDGEEKGLPGAANAAEVFKESGGVIVSVGIRAHGAGFALMSQIATEGLFMNALKTNSSDVAAYLSGSKGYYCAGNCDPQGNVTVGLGALNYASFEQWDVVSGTVDLIGGEYPYELFNVLPGHGLYVDLTGSSLAPAGKIRSKSDIPLIAGHNYRLTVHLAGNHRDERAGFTTRVRVENPENSVDETESIDDWTQPFTPYVYDFTAPSSANAKISLEQIEHYATPFGNLLNYVKFEDLTDAEVLLEDDFDSENEEFIEPECVSSDLSLLGYGYGYCLGYGCLDGAIPQQIPDPDPHTDPE